MSDDVIILIHFKLAESTSMVFNKALIDTIHVCVIVFFHQVILRPMLCVLQTVLQSNKYIQCTCKGKRNSSTSSIVLAYSHMFFPNIAS
jgi:hypothetical protein